jgi:hypothetical protein
MRFVKPIRSILCLITVAACCPVEDIVTVDVGMSSAFFRNYSSESFLEIEDEAALSYLDYAIVPITEASGFDDFEAPNRRAFQSPDCDTSDPDYNLFDPVVSIEISPNLDYNSAYPAESNMSNEFYSVFLNENPLRPALELIVHGNQIDIEAFNSHFLNYHDMIRRNQEPFEFYGLKPKISPDLPGVYTFQVVIKLSSGRMISSVTPPLFVTN